MNIESVRKNLKKELNKNETWLEVQARALF